MPEIAELHNATHYANEFSFGKSFIRVDVHRRPRSSSKGAGASEHDEKGDCTASNTEELLDGIESSWPFGYDLAFRSRGKEMCALLRPRLQKEKTFPNISNPYGKRTCMTCEIAHHFSGRGGFKQQNRKEREVWLRERIESNEKDSVWQLISSEGTIARLHLDENETKPAPPPPAAAAAGGGGGGGGRKACRAEWIDCDANASRKTHIVLCFFFGMQAGFRTTVEEGREIANAKLSFVREDGESLVFVGRDFRLGGWKDYRSPDPIVEHFDWLEHLKNNEQQQQQQQALQRQSIPVCEAMLDQSLFNGVGNYMRAEILLRSEVKPFEDFKKVMAREEARGKLLDTTFEICCEAVYQKVYRREYLGKRPLAWRAVYQKKDSKSEMDNLGRRIWYRGDRGPLPGPLVAEETSTTNKLHFTYKAMIPAILESTSSSLLSSITKEDMTPIFEKFGKVQRVVLNRRKRWGFVTFEDPSDAKECLCELGSRIDDITVTVQKTAHSKIEIKVNLELWSARKRSVLNVSKLISSTKDGGSSFIDEDSTTTTSSSDNDQEEVAHAEEGDSHQSSVEWEDCLDDEEEEDKQQATTSIFSPSPSSSPPPAAASPVVAVVGQCGAMSAQVNPSAARRNGSQRGNKPRKRKGGKIKLSELAADIDQTYDHLVDQESERRRRKSLW